ncbi:ASCH domain-containing protein [Candidatus Formimonas warabiya]
MHEDYTLWQPWASLIAEGYKKIETRSWKAPEKVIGQRITCSS